MTPCAYFKLIECDLNAYTYNFIHLSGPQSSVEGIFYSAGTSSKHIVLTKDNVPYGTINFPNIQNQLGGIAKNYIHIRQI